MALEPKPLGEKPAGEAAQSQNSDGNQSQNQGGGQGERGAGSAEKPTRPEWLPESHWDPEGSTIKPTFGEHYNELATFRQAETDRLAKVPKTAAEYKLELSPDLQLPEGVTREDLAIDENNPRLQAFREKLFSRKADPELANELYGLYVQEQAEQVAVINKRIGEEQQKLGGNFGERVAALGTFFEGRVGKDLAAAVMKGIFTADQVKALEQVAAQFSNQGAARIPAKGAEPNDDPGKIEGWDKMTFEEKRAHQNARKAG
jgi:hypothetical protein